MLVDINKIKVVDRIRKDFGDIQELSEDIKKNGLINPPTINKEYRLLAGERRLRACKLLGWTQIEVHMLDTKDEAHDLDVELSENNMRRNFTGSELAEGIRRQMAIEQEKAKGRMQDPMQTFAEGQTGTSRDKAAEQFGISGEQARKTLFVDEHRDLLEPTDFADWDEGRLSTNKAFQRIKAAQKQAVEERDMAKRVSETLKQERDNAKRELASAQQATMARDAEIASLRRQVAEKPKPEVVEREVEREVVREVVPSDYEAMKQRVKRLEYDRKVQDDTDKLLRKQLKDAKSELDRARGILNLDETMREVQRDVQYLITSTNQYVRHYGGLTWTAQSLADVDKPTIEELRKAVRNLATFANTLMNYLEELNV